MEMPARIIRRRPPVGSDLPPELPVNKAGDPPTEAQKAQVIREAVNYYIRTSLRAPDVRQICEDFIAALDVAAGGSEPPPLPDIAVVTITPTSDVVASLGGTGSIAVGIVDPGVSGTWTAEKDATADWLTYLPMTPQSASGTVNWNAAPNLETVERIAQLSINGEPFTLTQAGVTPPPAVVSLSPDVAPVLAAGGTGSVAVTIVTPGTWVVDADPLATWLTFTPTTPQTTAGTVDWTAGVNATGDTRQATLHVNGEPFTVNQAAV